MTRVFWYSAGALFCVLASACDRREPSRPRAVERLESVPAPSAVGWRLDIAGELVRAGAVRTTPGGAEEAFMPVLPGAIRRAAQACRADSGLPPGPSQTAFDLEVTAEGRFAPWGDPPTSAFPHCLVTQLVRDVRPPRSIAARIHVELQLVP